MPTHNGPETSGIRLYAQKFVDIADRFNVILKPHPDSFFEDPSHHYIRAFLEDGRVKVVRSPEDEAELFAISDVAVVDLGGSLFACLYAGTPVIVTDVRRENEVSPIESAIGSCSPRLTPENFGTLPVLLESQNAFAGQRNFMAEFGPRLFSHNNGNGGQMVADAIRALRGTAPLVA